jgi:hypothetical protein
MTEQSTAHHLREYETIFLVKPDLTDEGVDRVKERVRGIVNREGGRLIRFTVWGKKKTMYRWPSSPGPSTSTPRTSVDRPWSPRWSATSGTSTRSPAG